MADFDAQLPVRAVASQFTTEVANASGSTINPVEEFTQGSTTSGQSGPLIQGAVTTAAPSYSTAQTSPLSLDTAGNLRVAVTSLPASDENVNIDKYGGTSTTLGQKAMSSSIPVVIASDQTAVPVTISSSTVEITTYATASAIASNASNTFNYSPGSTVNFDGFECSASGAVKAELKIGTTGAETSRGVWFSSSSSRYISFRLPYPISVTSAQSVKLVVTNFDKQAMDLYATILSH